MRYLLIGRRHPSAAATHSEAKPYTDNLRKVRDRMEHPPATWASYEGRPDGDFDIITMEYRELGAMRESGTKEQVVKELYDLSAACLCAAHHMAQ